MKGRSANWQTPLFGHFRGGDVAGPEGVSTYGALFAGKYRLPIRTVGKVGANWQTLLRTWEGCLCRGADGQGRVQRTHRCTAGDVVFDTPLDEPVERDAQRYEISH